MSTPAASFSWDELVKLDKPTGPSVPAAAAPLASFSWDELERMDRRNGAGALPKAAFDPTAEANRVLAETGVTVARLGRPAAPAPLRGPGATGPVSPEQLAAMRRNIATGVPQAPAVSPLFAGKGTIASIAAATDQAVPPAATLGEIIDQYGQIASGIGKAAGKVAGVVVRAGAPMELPEAMATTPQQMKDLRREQATTITPLEAFTQQTTEDLARLGVEALPWLAAGHIAGAAIGAAQLPKWVATLARELVALGWTVPNANAAVRNTIQARYALQDHGLKSPEFVEAAGKAGVSAGFAVLGYGAVRKGFQDFAKAVPEAYTEGWFDLYQKADARAASAAAARFARMAPEERGTGNDAKVAFDQLFREAGGPDVWTGEAGVAKTPGAATAAGPLLPPVPPLQEAAGSPQPPAAARPAESIAQPARAAAVAPEGAVPPPAAPAAAPAPREPSPAVPVPGLRQIVEAGGAEYTGIQEAGQGARFVMFQVPIPGLGGTSAVLPIDGVTVEAVRAKVAQKLAQFAVRPEGTPKPPEVQALEAPAEAAPIVPAAAATAPTQMAREVAAAAQPSHVPAEPVVPAVQPPVETATAPPAPGMGITEAIPAPTETSTRPENLVYQGLNAGALAEGRRSLWFTNDRNLAQAHAQKSGPGGVVNVYKESQLPPYAFVPEGAEYPIPPTQYWKGQSSLSYTGDIGAPLSTLKADLLPALSEDAAKIAALGQFPKHVAVAEQRAGERRVAAVPVVPERRIGERRAEILQAERDALGPGDDVNVPGVGRGKIESMGMAPGGHPIASVKLDVGGTHVGLVSEMEPVGAGRPAEIESTSPPPSEAAGGVPVAPEVEAAQRANWQFYLDENNKPVFTNEYEATRAGWTRYGRKEIAELLGIPLRDLTPGKHIYAPEIGAEIVRLLGEKKSGARIVSELLKKPAYRPLGPEVLDAMVRAAREGTKAQAVEAAPTETPRERAEREFNERKAARATAERQVSNLMVGQEVLVDTPRGQAKGIVEGFRSGDVDEDFQRVDVRAGKLLYAGAHPDAVKPLPGAVERIPQRAEPETLADKAARKFEERKAARKNPATNAALAPMAAKGATIPPEEVHEAATHPGAERQVAAVSEPRGPSHPVATGERTVVRVPGKERSYPGRYAVRELSDIYASHDPFNFSKNPAYHYTNDRDYGDPINQERVVVSSLPARFDPSFLLTDNPDATNGPPVIEANGNVLGGNNRTMILLRVYADNAGAAAAYRAELAKRAVQYGIDPATIAGMAQPILVRELDEAGLDPQRAVSDFNKTPTAALTAAERATADARTLPEEASKYIGSILDTAPPNSTLNDVLVGKYGMEVVHRLVRAGVFTMQEKPQLITSGGVPTPQAKERISKMFLGELFRDSDQYRRTEPSLRNKLERIVVPVAQAAGKAGWDIRAPLREAIDLVEYARVHGMRNLDDALKQTDFTGQAPVVSPRGIILAEFIRSNGPHAVTEGFRQYAKDSGAPGLFGGVNSTESFTDAFGKVPQPARSATTAPTTAMAPGPGARTAGTEPTGGGTMGMAAGPGARTAGTERPAGTPLAQLTEAIGNIRAGERGPSRIGEAAREKGAAAVEAVKNAMATVAGASRALWDAYAEKPRWDSYLKLLGEWQFRKTKNEAEVIKALKEFEKAVPDKTRRRAISRFVESFGEAERRIEDGRLPAETDKAQAAQDILREWADASAGSLKSVYEKAAQLTPDERAIAENIVAAQDEMLEQAINRGYLEGGVEGYMKHVWKRPNPFTRKVSAEFALSRLPVNPAFAKRRVFPTLFDGEQAGYESVSDDAAFLVARRQSEFAQAEAARAFVAGLFKQKAADGMPIMNVSGAYVPITEGEAQKGYLIKPLAKAGAATADGRPYERLDHPSLRKWKWLGEDDAGKPIFALGDALVHPDYFKMLRAALGKSAIRENIAGRAVLKVSSVFKHTMLLGPFHQVHVGEHGIFHLANAFKPPELVMEDPADDPNHQLYNDLGIGKRGWKKPIPLATLLPALKHADEGVRGRARAALVAELVKHGMVVGADFGALAEFSEGLHGGGLLTYVPGIGKYVERYENYLFGHDGYIPRLKADMAVGAAGRNYERYGKELNDDEILSGTADQANAAFGELNYAKLGRNPTAQDLLRLILLAPDFLEARGRFAGQALKPHGREQSDALLRSIFVMAALAYLLVQVLQKAGLHAEWHWQRPFSVIVNDREYRSRSVVGDAIHLVSNPQNFVNFRLNPLTTRTLLELLSGRDRFGHKRTVGEQAKDIVKTGVPIPAQGFLHKADMHWWESVLSSVGIPVRKYRTPAGQLAYETARDMAPLGEGTEQQKEANALARRLIDGLRVGTVKPDDVMRERAAGKLTVPQAKRIMSEAKLSELEHDFKRLRLGPALDVWGSASPEEQAKLRRLLIYKANDTLKNYVPAERELLRDRYWGAMNQLSAAPQ